MRYEDVMKQKKGFRIERVELFEAIIAFDHWCTFHHIGSEVRNND